MLRRTFIERTLRQIYGDQPSDDANITIGLVNAWLQDAIALAAKTNYKENIAIDGVGYINNSFYTRFTGLTISVVDNFTLWKVTLPEIPLGIGRNEGISTLELVDVDTQETTRPFIPLSQNQKTYHQNMRPIPNKVLYYYEGNLLYIISTILLNEFTVNVTMVSGGDSTDLDSNLNVPADYYPVMVEYLKQQLMFERGVPQDVTSDGSDIIKTT